MQVCSKHTTNFMEFVFYSRVMPVPIGEPIPAFRLSDRSVLTGPPALTSSINTSPNSRLIPVPIGEPMPASQASDHVALTSAPVPVTLMRNVAAAVASTGASDYTTPAYMPQFSSAATNALYGPRRFHISVC